MKVFGIGLNKTGTTTLGKALEILGFTPHIGYHPGYCLDFLDGRIYKIINAAQKASSFQDLPWSFMYTRLYEEFKDAKFILTKRSSSQVWINSYKKHSEREGPKVIRELFYGYKMPHGHEKEYIELYDKHNREVEEFFSKVAPQNFMTICFENGEGWEKLCRFLHKDIPRVDLPWLNSDPDRK